MNIVHNFWALALLLSVALLPQRAFSQDVQSLPKMELQVIPQNALSMVITVGDKEATIYVDEHRGTLIPHKVPAGEDYTLSVSSATNEATIYGELVSAKIISQKVFQIKVDGMKSLEELSAFSCGLNDLSLKGCDRLKSLSLMQNNLSELSLAETPALQELNVGYNVLRELDCSPCPNLLKLVCGKNDLTKVNISGCTKLYEINVQMNKKLTALDLSSCKALMGLTCASTGITDIDVSGCEKLTFIDSSFSPVQRLKARGCKSLKTLNCYQNDLYNIDLKGCVRLDKLTLQHNPNLGLLDITTLSSLVTLLCSDCGLKEIKIGDLPSLQEFYSFDNKLVALDFSGAPNLRELQCDNNQLQSLQLASSMPMLELVSVVKNKLSACAIDSLCVALPEKEQGGQLRIAANPGAPTSKSYFAADKGWTIDILGDGSGCSINVGIESVGSTESLCLVDETGITLLPESAQADVALYTIEGETLYRFAAQESRPTHLTLPSGRYLLRVGEMTRLVIIP